MSGGFFRGTSADQDTRFSNKQAKLLKSQKFPPELDHLVDMTKVKMDVIRPWIATRVTELLGFEDEVLINFIYGLLDGKEVNGKQVQISLTGFMEKNTGKFMKELWTLLLSAQRNASGVPQQFLDAKEEEARKKKAESDRIANEIQKKKDKENRELEQERLRKMDEGNEKKAGDLEQEPSSKNMLQKGSSAHAEDRKNADQRNGVGRKRISRSPRSTDHSPSPRGSRSRSVSRSLSNSRSYSDGKQKSRSVSRSPQPRRRSISSDRMYPSPRRRSLTPRSSYSPARRGSSYSRRRSRSHSPRRSPSPIRPRLRSPYRRRSPIHVPRRTRAPIRRHRSPSPIRRQRSSLSLRRHRSPSPFRRRRSPSPMRRRSPLPVRRRSPSPVRRRSPSPVRRRSPSPVRRRSPPVRRRSPSPVRRRSPSPVRRRSPLPVRRRSPSPLWRQSPPSVQRRSPSPVRQQRRRSSSTPRHRSSSLVRRRSPASNHRSITPSHGRSPSPSQSSSLSPVQHRSSPFRRSPKEQRRSPLLSPGERQRMGGKLSPVRHRPSSLRSSDRDLMDQRDAGDTVPPLSPSPNKSPVSASASEERRSSSPYEIPMRQKKELIVRDSQGTGRKNEASRSRHSPPASKERVSPRKVHTPKQLASSRSTETQGQPDNMESRKKDLEMRSEKSSGKGADLGTPDRRRSPALSKDPFQGDKQSASHPREGKRSNERNHSRHSNMKDSSQRHKAEASPMLLDKVNNNHGLDSGSEGSDKHRTKHKEKRKHRRSERREVTSDDDSSYDSEIEDRREAKRRRKEEKRLRKEEKRRRREERRRRKEERRAERLKVKGEDDESNSDGEHVARRKSYLSDVEEAGSEQKKLEIELRKKALESLKAKKGISR